MVDHLQFGEFTWTVVNQLNHPSSVEPHLGLVKNHPNKPFRSQRFSIWAPFWLLRDLFTTYSSPSSDSPPFQPVCTCRSVSICRSIIFHWQSILNRWPSMKCLKFYRNLTLHNHHLRSTELYSIKLTCSLLKYLLNAEKLRSQILEGWHQEVKG